jgi:hypothetical protein
MRHIFIDHGNTIKDGYYTSEVIIDGNSYWSHCPIPTERKNHVQIRYAFDMAFLEDLKKYLKAKKVSTVVSLSHWGLFAAEREYLSKRDLEKLPHGGFYNVPKFFGYRPLQSQEI